MVPSEELKEAFSVKYERYGDMLFKQCMVYLGNHIEAEEVMQEVFIKLIYKAPKFSTIEDEKRWVIRVTINLCKDRLKSFWRKKVISIEEIEFYAKSEEEINLTEFILKLPYKYKTVIHLYYYEGYKVKEIAEILKIRESAVKMRLKRGREILKMEVTNSEEGGL